MIIISHINAKKQVQVIRNDNPQTGFSESLVKAFWEVCEKYPKDLILWQEEGIEINTESIDEVFQHSLVMASYPVKEYFIPDTIGYVDQLPFVNPSKNVKYPTWRMSVAIGGVYGETALRLKSPLKEISNFGVLINSIAKIGQQNSLFCYSHPALLKKSNWKLSLVKTETKDLFSFVAQHYKKVRLLILLLCFIRYEKAFPIWSFLTSIFKKSFFQCQVELPELEENLEWINNESIDVIIPTLGRPKYLKNVLINLKNQKLLPARVIIVEQNPEVNSESALDYLKSETWPFEIVHHFTNQLGACNARNIALDQVKSNWVFFADDDIRFEDVVLRDALRELDRLKVNALNINCLQPGEKLVFSKIKQWGAFGSGTSIVKANIAKNCRFSREFENGFGEDTDYGISLRNSGCDIIYHPDITIRHLKASRGGFRKVQQLNNQQSHLKQPKPSPTMMLLVKKHFNEKMEKGYKINLFLKFYKKQPIKNPFTYYKSIQGRWSLSETLSQEIKDSIRN